MKNLYKLNSSKSLKRFSHYISVETDDGVVVYTNEESEPYAIADGWKELIVDEKPTYDVDTEYLDYEYEEQEDYIYQHWEVKQLPPPQAEEEDYKEQLERLGVNLEEN